MNYSKFYRKSKSNSNSSGSGTISIGEDASLKALKEEDPSPENKSRFRVGPAGNVKASADIQKTEEVGVEQVVEKQDMEKLEKEEEGKVEKRGRFNVLFHGTFELWWEKLLALD